MNEADFAAKLQKMNDDFERLMQERHEMGAKKYGPVKFMEVDSLEEATEELVDFANYIRYTYIKVRLLQEYLGGVVHEPEPLGKESYKKGGL